MSDRVELEPLAPSPAEIAMSGVACLHAALVLVVVTQLLRGKITLPHGVWGLIVLLCVPVVGPLLVLTWRARGDRVVGRSQVSGS